jgi:hypothetical protein
VRVKPKFMDGRWYIEVHTEEFGNVLLLKREEVLPIPVSFETEKEAWDYIKLQ